MRFFLSSLFTWVLLFTFQTWAGGSRVGNGDGDSGKTSVRQKIPLDKSYDIETTFPFFSIMEFTDGVRIEGPAVFKARAGFINANFSVGVSPVRQKVNLRRLSEQRPEFKNLSYEKTLRYFEQNHWQASPSLQDACIEAWKISNSELVTAVVTWGNGEGYLAVADNTPQAIEALEQIIQSTKRKNKDCLWK